MTPPRKEKPAPNELLLRIQIRKRKSEFGRCSSKGTGYMKRDRRQRIPNARWLKNGSLLVTLGLLGFVVLDERTEDRLAVAGKLHHAGEDVYVLI